MARLAAALLVLACAAPAAARDKVVVGSFRVAGESLTDPVRATLRAGALAALQAAGFDPISDEETARAAAPDLSGCGTFTCLRRLAERLGAPRMVNVDIRLVGGSNYVIGLALVDAADGRAVAHGDEKCEVCNQREALDAIGAAAAALRKQLDGAPAPGAAAAPAKVTATVITTSTPRPRVLAAAGIACAALGLSALAVGIPLLAIDGDVHARHVDSTGHFVVEQYRTTGTGAAFTAIGLALGVASGVLFWRDHAERAVAVAPALGPRATALVLDGRF
jgi:hypothetical protein